MIPTEGDALRSSAPPSWDVLPLKQISSGVAGLFTDGDWIESLYITNEGVRLIQTGNVGIGIYKEQGGRYVSEETFRSLRCTEVLPGDVLICRLADPVGRACLAPDLACKMITSVDVAILRPSRRCDRRYLTYYLSSDRYLGYLQAICRGGTRDRVSRSMLGDIPVLFPPPDQQTRIADFLEGKTRAIDEVVRSNERLIDRVHEYRQALISAAVTKGLDPNAPMKDSGLRWLGAIPKHWTIKPIKFLASVDNSGVWGEDPDDSENALPVATTAHIRPDGELLVDEMPLRMLSKTEKARYRCRFGDILVVKSSGSATNVISGKAGMVGEKEAGIAFSNFLLRLRPNLREIDPRFLFRFVSSSIIKERIRVMVSTTTYPNLRVGEYLRFEVPLPPLLEQTAIADFLEDKTQAIDEMVLNRERLVDVLQEYRLVLISGAVSGHIDVTDEAAA